MGWGSYTRRGGGQKVCALESLSWVSKLSGHNSRDRSECVNVIGVISEPCAVNGRK